MNNQNKNYWYHASFVSKFEHYNLDIVSDFDFDVSAQTSASSVEPSNDIRIFTIVSLPNCKNRKQYYHDTSGRRKNRIHR